MRFKFCSSSSRLKCPSQGQKEEPHRILLGGSKRSLQRDFEAVSCGCFTADRSLQLSATFYSCRGQPIGHLRERDGAPNTRSYSTILGW